MKKNFFAITIIAALFTSCGGGVPPTDLIIQTPFTPQPSLLLMTYTSSSTQVMGVPQDLTSQISQPINKQLEYGERVEIFSLFPATGSFNNDEVTTPVPPPTNYTPIIYQIDPAKTRYIELELEQRQHTTHAGLIQEQLHATSGFIAPNEKDLTLVYTGLQTPSWGNLPPSGPFANQPVPVPTITNTTSYKSTGNSIPTVFAIQHVTINSIFTNMFQAMMRIETSIIGNNIGNINRRDLDIPEVHIGYEKFGTSSIIYYPIPSSSVSYNGAELKVNMPMPQPTIPPLKGLTPQPGIYHLRLILRNAANTLRATSEISPACVRWEL
jgi:hypothetical protein